MSIKLPQATNDSLFAKATFLSHSIALSVGRSPKKPTSALTTSFELESSITCKIASSPKYT